MLIGLTGLNIRKGKPSMILHRSSELAIQAALFLAQQAPGKLSPVHEIAAHTGVSEAYLSKVLQPLTSAGLVRSFRGFGKGMELARSPERITLSSLIHATQGVLASDACVLGLGICSEENPCAIHRDWVPLRNAIRDLVEKTTLADLIQNIRLVEKTAVKEGGRS
ncbi:MAG: Rrf2 family transcriptional regulator [Acidobacteria bacterium]|nr:Rrf2 family transcriptional regulator [Acidobacteriota bacterium]